MSDETRDLIRHERMRMSQVRQSLGKSLDGAIRGTNDALSYYAACSHYLHAALERLHAQDQRIIDLLDPVVPNTDEANRQILASFDRGLSRSRVALDRLMLALENYQLSGSDGQARFEEEARAFLDVFINVLGARRHTSSHLEEQHFSDQDWVFVADSTEQSRQRERELFQQVKQTASKDADPDSFVAGPPPGSGN